MSRAPERYRDEELGAALRELEVPEHQPGFEGELRLLLAGERVRDAGRTNRRRSRRRWSLRLAAAAAVVAVAVFAVGLPDTERTPRLGPEAATAAEIQAQVRAALGGMRNLSGVLVSDGPQKGDERRWQFTLTSRGDFLLVGPGQGERIAYDASTGVARSAQTAASAGGDELFYAVRRGIAPGLPDQAAPGWLLPDEFGAFVRALLAAKDPRVEEVTYDGRSAWQLAVDARPNAIVPEFSGDGFELTVDRETGIPVRILETKDGAFLSEVRIESLAVNRDLPAGTFRFPFPAGAEVVRSDEGFRRMTLAEAEQVVGYAPLVPAWVPEGYELAEVAVALESAPTGAEAGNPVSRNVVSLSYRRGLDQFLVTTRLARVPPEIWSDPLATGEGFVDAREPVTIGAGALAGRPAELVIVPRGIPHLWALGDGLAVTVGGDLSRAELVRVTESLRRR